MTDMTDTTRGFEHRAATRHLRLLGAQLRLSLLAALEYRVGFWTDGVLGLAWNLGGLVPLLVAFDHRQDVAGWGPWEIVLLTGFFLIVSGIFASSVQPAIAASMAHIRDGTLDYVLLRPVDGLLSCLLAGFQPWCLLEVLTGIGLAIVASVQLGLSPGVEQLAMLVLVLASGLVSLYAIGVLILAASFRALALENLTFLMETLLDFAHWPISVFRGPLKLVFTFVVPFAVMTSYPAQSLIGGLERGQVLGALISAGSLAVLARLAWLRGVRGYTSASS
jgi:ABC-2 type transport system permease protein